MAESSRKKRVTFTLNQPEATSVSVAGSFNGWDTEGCRLKRQKDGTWKRTENLPPGPHEYRFVVDGMWRDDPGCEERRPNEFGEENCVITV
jgi:1,4-alpha-glucan branching enzyme